MKFAKIILELCHLLPERIHSPSCSYDLFLRSGHPPFTVGDVFHVSWMAFCSTWSIRKTVQKQKHNSTKSKIVHGPKPIGAVLIDSGPSVRHQLNLQDQSHGCEVCLFTYSFQKYQSIHAWSQRNTGVNKCQPLETRRTVRQWCIATQLGLERYQERHPISNTQ